MQEASFKESYRSARPKNGYFCGFLHILCKIGGISRGVECGKVG